jgi:hypothetical protein
VYFCSQMMNMKKGIQLIGVLVSVFVCSQTRAVKKPFVKNTLKANVANVSVQDKKTIDFPVVNGDLPPLIPKKRDGNFGYVNQKGKFIIQPEYHIAVFFYEDCNLLNSPNEKLRKFGTAEYATVEKNEISYRIDKKGRKVYQFKQADLGKCVHKEYTQQLFQAYVLNGFYGIIEKSVFKDPQNYKHFKIYPQYDYLYILEGDDVANPMIIASKNNTFGVIDVDNNIIIPFEYEDIKRNFSWKLGKLFDVSKDGKNYYYVDSNNKSY